MCAHYEQDEDFVRLGIRFKLHKPEREGLREQIAKDVWPKKPSLIITGKPADLEVAQWGFILPQISEKTGKPLAPKAVSNARQETVNTSPMFRGALQTQRCIFPLLAWYEYWVAQKRWVRIIPKEGTVGVAGLYKTDMDGLLHSTMITTSPHDAILPYHNRQPLVLHPDDEMAWLDPNTDRKLVMDIVRSRPEVEVEVEDAVA